MNMGDTTDLWDPGNNARHYSIKTGGAHDSNSFCTKRMLLICVVLQAIVLGICIIIFAIHVSTSTADNHANYQQQKQMLNGTADIAQVRLTVTDLTNKRFEDIRSRIWPNIFKSLIRNKSGGSGVLVGSNWTFFFLLITLVFVSMKNSSICYCNFRKFFVLFLFFWLVFCLFFFCFVFSPAID